MYNSHFNYNYEYLHTLTFEEKKLLWSYWIYGRYIKAMTFDENFSKINPNGLLCDSNTIR